MVHKLSPLFWPIEFKDKAIYILDETKLPEKLVYLKAVNYHQAVQAIRDMKTRAVGQVLLVMYTFLLEMSKGKRTDAILPRLEKIAEAINAARPTLSFKMLTDMVLKWQRGGVPLEKMINGFLEALKQARMRQAAQMAVLLSDGDSILTHCNISGLMPLIGQLCKKDHKRISFYVTETRPYLQGARLTAWELVRAGFEVTVISDNMVAHLMYEGKVNKVIVGADHLAANGDIANKIGTFQIALLAKNFTLPFYVICPPASTIATGKEIRIEIRPEKELLEFQGRCIAPKGAKGYYPAFDVTPNELITGHIYLELPREN